MENRSRAVDVRGFVRRKPLQAGKLAAISLTLVLGAMGFFGVINAVAFIDDPFLADGQFLTLILLPLLSLGLVCVVVCETLVAGYRVLRRDRSVRQQLTARPSYTVLRGIEVSVAVAGVTFIVTAVSVLLTESMPAGAGVGLMLALMAAGIGILVASFVRTLLELAYYGDTS